MSETESKDIICPNCNSPVAIRNPTGKCDHLYWPDLLTSEAKRKIGKEKLNEIHQAMLRLVFGG